MDESKRIGEEGARPQESGGGSGSAAGFPSGAPAAPEDERSAATQRSLSRWRRSTTPRSVTDRLTIYVVRAVFFLVAAGLGIQGARTFSNLNASPEIFGFTGMLVACAVALVLIVLEALFAKSPIRTIAAVCFGLLMGLVLSVVFQHVVRMIVQAVVPDMAESHRAELLSFLNLMTTCIFCYFGVTLLLDTKDDFKFIIPYVEFRKQLKSHMPLILDTSVFVDGRFQALLATGILDQRLEVPRFVLDELQSLADSPERSIRERGRRGMDILHDVEQHHWVDLIEFPLRRDEDVDSGLVRLAIVHEGKLVTTDHNLTKRARLQGVRVLNMNDLATALKPALVPGEVLRVTLLRAGEEAGQAVGFLRDGTMVVVEQGRDRIGQEVSIEVTSAIQTSAGRMVFGKLRGAGKSAARK